MIRKIFDAGYKYDIALDDGAGASLVTWITGLMVFFVTLALAANLMLNGVTQKWVSGLEGSLTVELQQDVADASITTKTAQRILGLSERHPAVASARALPRKEIEAMIEPWLGGNIPSGVTLPLLIDIKLNPEADIVKLQADIKAIAPQATIDTHDAMLDDVRILTTTARSFVVLLTAVIIALAAVTIAGIVGSKLAIHRPEVETLHLIGASDEYIARQFRHHTLKGTLKGSVFAVALVIVCMGILALIGARVDENMFPSFSPGWGDIAAILLLPVLCGCLIAHWTAQRTISRDLERMF